MLINLRFTVSLFSKKRAATSETKSDFERTVIFVYDEKLGTKRLLKTKPLYQLCSGDHYCPGLWRLCRIQIVAWRSGRSFALLFRWDLAHRIQPHCTFTLIRAKRNSTHSSTHQHQNYHPPGKTSRRKNLTPNSILIGNRW